MAEITNPAHVLTPLEIEIIQLKETFNKLAPYLDDMEPRQYVEFVWLFRSLYSNGEMMDQVQWMMKLEDD